MFCSKKPLSRLVLLSCIGYAFYQESFLRALLGMRALTPIFGILPLSAKETRPLGVRRVVCQMLVSGAFILRRQCLKPCLQSTPSASRRFSTRIALATCCFSTRADEAARCHRCWPPCLCCFPATPASIGRSKRACPRSPHRHRLVRAAHRVYPPLQCSLTHSKR